LSPNERDKRIKEYAMLVFYQKPGLRSPSAQSGKSRAVTILKHPSSTNTSGFSRAYNSSALTNSQRLNGDRKVRFKDSRDEDLSSKELVKRKF